MTGDEFREMRSPLSQSQLGHLWDKSPQLISKIEQGEEVAGVYRFAIERVAQMDYDELMEISRSKADRPD